MDNTFEINHKLFLYGDFTGKYISKEKSISGNSTFSNIKILEGALNGFEKYDFNNLFKIASKSLFHRDNFEMEINIDDESFKDKYIFKEDISNSTLYDIVLSDQLKEGNKTFGVIKGKLIFSLTDSSTFELFQEKFYEVSKEIDFGDQHYVDANVQKLKYFFRRNLNLFNWLKNLKNRLFKKKKNL